MSARTLLGAIAIVATLLMLCAWLNDLEAREVQAIEISSNFS